MGIVYIYSLSDKSGIRYIGKSICPKKRLKQHIYNAFRPNSKEYWYVRSIWFRDKKDEIYQTIIEECNDDNWIEREIFWINKYSKICKLVNQCDGGKGPHGFKRSAKQIEQMRQSKIGFKHSDETKKKMSEARKGIFPTHLIGFPIWNKGKGWSDEMKKKLSDAHLGQVAWNKGIPNSVPSRKGSKHSPQTLAIFKEQRKNISDEHRRKMSEAKKGRILSDETKRRMSESHKKRQLELKNK